MTQPQAAAVVGVSPRHVRRAAALLKNDPAVFKQVHEGKVSLDALPKVKTPKAPPVSPARNVLTYEELLGKALASAEQLRLRLSRALESRPVPTDAAASELEVKIKAKLARIAELGEKLPKDPTRPSIH